MYTGLLHLHSTLRWVILILIVIMLIRSFAGRSGNRTWNDGDRKMVLFAMIAGHIQLIVGIYQWAVGNWGLAQIQLNGMADTMKNAAARFYAVEHFVGMLIVIGLLTVANSTTKRPIEDVAKYKKIFMFYAIALVLILALVPWPFRAEGIARGWLAGMM
jgi:hypothetical protein